MNIDPELGESESFSKAYGDSDEKMKQKRMNKVIQSQQSLVSTKIASSTNNSSSFNTRPVTQGDELKYFNRPSSQSGPRG